jgi:hypothetical protein
MRALTTWGLDMRGLATRELAGLARLLDAKGLCSWLLGRPNIGAGLFEKAGEKGLLCEFCRR